MLVGDYLSILGSNEVLDASGTGLADFPIRVYLFFGVGTCRLSNDPGKDWLEANALESIILGIYCKVFISFGLY